MKISLPHFVLLTLVGFSLLAQPALAKQGLGQLPDGLGQSPEQDLGELPTEIPAVRPNPDRLPSRDFLAPNDRESARDQATVINSKFAGWEAASEGSARVGTELRGNWAMVDANGRFEGVVVPGRGASVESMNIFLMNQGRLVKQTTVAENGRFEFNNVRQGCYSLIGWGSKGFFAFGVNILGFNPDADASVMKQLRITAFQNETTINTDWIRFYAARVSYRVFGGYDTGEGRNDPPALFGFEGLVANQPASKPATSISSHPVSKTVDGRLVGRVHQMNSINGRPVDVRTTQVLLLENDSLVASTTTDNYGVFEFQQVPDGSYGLAAVGVDGVGLIAIDVGSGDTATPAGDVIDFTMVSSETIGWLNHYAGEVAYRRALLAPRPPAPPVDQYAGMCPQCGNQAGGCNTCQNAYANSICRSRGLTFEQWQMYCQGQPGAVQIGDGQLIAKFADAIRDGVERTDRVFERAFYGNSNSNLNYGQYGQGAGYGNGYGGYAAPTPLYNPAPMYSPAQQYVPATGVPVMQEPTPALPPIIQGGM